MRDVAAAPLTPAPSMIPTSTTRHSTARENHMIGRTTMASYSSSTYHFLLRILPSPVSAGAAFAGARTEPTTNPRTPPAPPDPHPPALATTDPAVLLATLRQRSKPA